MKKVKGIFPKRKRTRLKNFDYSTNGAYFVTICVKDKQKILWSENRCNNVGANCVRPPGNLPLSAFGNAVKDEIERINFVYSDIVKIDKYVVMPNHIHMIVVIDTYGRTQFAPTLSRVIKQFKGSITKQIGKSIFQKSFHDHIIRDQADYLKIWNYIETNPAKWQEDCFYIE